MADKKPKQDIPRPAVAKVEPPITGTATLGKRKGPVKLET